MVKYVLATGQSNMRGRYPAGGPPFSVATRVTAWDNTNPLGANGTAWVTPTEGSAPFNSDGSSNLALWFCHRMSQELDEDVRLILVARDSSSLDLWAPTSGSMWQEIVDVHDAAGNPLCDVFLWHQGESGGTNYKTAWLTMRTALTSYGILNSDAPSILGGLQGVRIGGTNDTYLQELAEENDDIYYASSLNLDDGGDGLHFSGPDLHHFGYFRYWDKYREHIGPAARKTTPVFIAPGTRFW